MEGSWANLKGFILSPVADIMRWWCLRSYNEYLGSTSCHTTLRDWYCHFCLLLERLTSCVPFTAEIQSNVCLCFGALTVTIFHCASTLGWHNGEWLESLGAGIAQSWQISTSLAFLTSKSFGPLWLNLWHRQAFPPGPRSVLRCCTLSEKSKLHFQLLRHVLYPQILSCSSFSLCLFLNTSPLLDFDVLSPSCVSPDWREGLCITSSSPGQLELFPTGKWGLMRIRRDLRI